MGSFAKQKKAADGIPSTAFKAHPEKYGVIVLFYSGIFNARN
uniref:Uncharacterized protein n=1 Tax=Methylophaga nitratireducenticrescens TaxID=754476 RepID=I1XII2_METNJ